jgi:predicted kinase
LRNRRVRIDRAHEHAKGHLRARESFIWNATNTTSRLRGGLIDLFAAYGARIRIVYCEASRAEMAMRNARRRKPVPECVIEKLLDHLDVPDLTEAHEVVCAVNIGFEPEIGRR